MLTLTVFSSGNILPHRENAGFFGLLLVREDCDRGPSWSHVRDDAMADAARKPVVPFSEFEQLREARAIIGREVIAPSVVDNIKQADVGSLKLEYLMENVPSTREEALAIRDDAVEGEAARAFTAARLLAAAEPGADGAIVPAGALEGTGNTDPGARHLLLVDEQQDHEGGDQCCHPEGDFDENGRQSKQKY